MNKILSHMMLHCIDKISTSEIDFLQKYKDFPGDFDPYRKDYEHLLNYDLGKLFLIYLK